MPAAIRATKAGTKSKPKSEKFKLVVKNDPASKTTASGVEVTLPSTLKLSTSGLTQCKATDTELLANINTCKSSFAGTGEANALLTEQGVKVGNPSQCVKQNLTAKRVFKHLGRYRVSQTGLEYLRQMLGDELPG